MSGLVLVSVNVGRARLIPGAEQVGLSGIYKEPASGPVRVGRHGLAGDDICHTEDHGGPDQAVYAYGEADYRWWEARLGRALTPGTFGENLTIRGIDSNLDVGDRLVIGTVALEATAPRIPCANFAARMGDPRFARAFREAARPGVYFRVLGEGEVSAGDAVRLELAGAGAVSVMELYHGYYDPSPDEATLRRHLDAPIAARLKVRKEAQLAKLTAQV